MRQKDAWLVVIDVQLCFEYWIRYLSPYKTSMDHDTDEYWAWFDRWIVWLLGCPIIDGTDVQYTFRFNDANTDNLVKYGIGYRVIDQYGDDISEIRWRS